MSGTKGHRGFGHIRRQPTKSARYSASFIGADLKRHFAPVTFDEKTNAELWLAKERRIMQDALSSGEVWLSPAVRAAQAVAFGETLGDYATKVIKERNLKPRTRIHYESILDAHFGKLADLSVCAITPAAVRAWYSLTLVDK